MDNGKKMEKRIYIPVIIVIVLATILMMAIPEAAKRFSEAALDFIRTKLGWMYLLVAVAMFVFSIWVAFSKYGNIKLGAPEDKKQYSDWSWFAMMLAAGVGVGIMLLGLTEPIKLLAAPPFGLEPMSDQAYAMSHSFYIFIYSFIPWSIYVPVTLAVAYSIYVKKADTLRASTAVLTPYGLNPNGWLGTLIDCLVMISLIGGISTALGMGAPAVTMQIENLTGIKASLGVTVVVLIIWALIFGTSVFLGLDKGIKNLSNINMYLMLFLFAVILTRYPVVDFIDTMLTSVGLMFDNMWTMALGESHYTSGNFSQNWTVFYWAWWMGYMPMMALFGARISKGRTLRQLIFGILVYGGCGNMATIGFMGAYALYLQRNGILDLIPIMNEGGAAAVVIAVVEQLPMAQIMLWITLILFFVFLATTIDSTAYTLASICSVHILGDEQPARANRMLWAVILLLFSLGLVFVGGLEAVQTASVVLCFPMIFVCILAMFSLRKSFKQNKF